MTGFIYLCVPYLTSVPTCQYEACQGNATSSQIASACSVFLLLVVLQILTQPFSHAAIKSSFMTLVLFK